MFDMINELFEGLNYGEFPRKLQEEDNKKIKEIVLKLKEYDIFDFISKVAALNLIPCNQNKCIILDALINGVLSEDNNFFDGSNKISIKKLKDAVNEGMQLNQAVNIDPADMPFVQQIQFFGNYFIMSGINTDVGYNLQSFINVLFKKSNKFNEEFLDKCNRMTALFLTISTDIITDLGFDINSLGHYQKKEMVFPSSQELNDLSELLIINTAIIREFIDESSEKDLYLYHNNMDSEHIEDYNNYSFYYKPLLKIDDNHAIILNPTMLSTFLINYIIRTAEEYGILDDLIYSYNSEAFLNCKHSLKMLGHSKIQEDCLGIKLINNSNYKELLLNVCNDSLLFVQFFCDDAQNYDCNKMFEHQKPDFFEYEKRKSYIEEKTVNIFGGNLYSLVVLNTFGRGIEIPMIESERTKQIMLSPFDLMCVSINEFEHANFIPRYINSKRDTQLSLSHFSDIYNIAIYTKNNYSFYLDDDVDVRTALVYLGFDDAIDYKNKALQKEDRQLITYKNSNLLKEIIINNADRRIYSTVASRRIELLIRFSNIDIWVTCSEATSQDDLDTKYTLSDIISYWLSELKDIIENANFNTDVIHVEIITQGESDKYYYISSNQKSILAEILKIENNDNIIQMYWVPEAFASLDSLDNSKEKELMLLLLDKIFEYTDSTFDMDAINKTFENGIKKKLFSLDYHSYPYLKPTKEKVRKIPVECEEELLNEIGYYFLKNKHLSPGIISQENKSDVCNEIVDFLYKKLEKMIQEINPQGFFETIYNDLETVVYSLMLTQKRYSYDVACYPEKKQKINDDFNDLNKSSIALKFLLEYISAVHPSGDKVLGELDYEYLLTVCSLIVEWAHFSDLFRYKIIDNHISLLDSGRIGFDKSEFNRLNKSNFQAINARLTGSSHPHKKKYSDSDLAKDMSSELEAAFEDEFGYSFAQLSIFVHSLIEIGNDINYEVKRLNIDLVCDKVFEISQFSKELSLKIIDDISLKKREKYLSPPKPFSKNDVYPWRHNRSLSFNRRPIIFVNNDLIWGNRQLYHSLLFTFDLIMEGKFKSKSKKLTSFIGNISDKRGNKFNEAVATKINGIDSISVYSKVKKVNGVPIAGEDKNTLGDIDVLIINHRKKKIIVCEAKAFSFSKTPYEMHQEYLDVFCDKGNKLCYLSKHKRRVEWIENHVDDVIEFYKLEKGKWRIDDIFITNEIIVSNEFYHKHQKIILYSDITPSAILKL